MYKLHLIIIFSLLFHFCDGQVWKVKLDSLVTHRQYLSAYTMLENLNQPSLIDVQLAKANLAIDFYASSRYHRHFGFVDLRPGEDLEEIRKADETQQANYYLPVDTMLLNLKLHYPDDYRVYHLLGKYYNAVFLLFGDRWGKKSEWLLDQSQYYFSEAYKHGVYDYYSLYVMGYYNTLTENYHEAQYWYEKSLLLKDDPLTNYNLAVACLFDGLFSKGLQFADRAYLAYSDSLKKADAARITGILYLKQERNSDALNYFEKANVLSPGYKPNQLYLLKTYLDLNMKDKADKLAGEVLVQNVYSPDIPQEFLDMYRVNDQLDWLKAIFDKVLTQCEGDNEAMGNVLFHYAKLEYDLNRKNKSRRLIKKAKNYFLQVFDDGHQVFQAIDQMLEQMDQ